MPRCTLAITFLIKKLVPCNATSQRLLAPPLSKAMTCDMHWKHLAIISDDASQFAVPLLPHGPCWVHAGRTIHKPNPGNPFQQATVERVRGRSGPVPTPPQSPWPPAGRYPARRPGGPLRHGISAKWAYPFGTICLTVFEGIKPFHLRRYSSASVYIP